MRKPSNIKYMTFDELRNELGNCDNNPVKESIIRHMMKQRYYEHQRQKEMIKRRKMILNQQHMQEKMHQLNMQKEEQNRNNQQVQLDIDSLVADIEDNISNEGDMMARQSYSSNDSNESDMMARQSYSSNDSNESDMMARQSYSSNNLTSRDFLDQNNDSGDDSKSAKEITRDHLNNNLMSRMGADIAIRKFKDPRHSRDSDFESPFANGAGDGYVSFDKIRR